MNAGKTIGHYRIIRPLGKGGMGEVYLGEDTKLQRQVAQFLPKSVRYDPDWRLPAQGVVDPRGIKPG